jgi:hypothetical protein
VEGRLLVQKCNDSASVSVSDIETALMQYGSFLHTELKYSENTGDSR